MEKYPNKDPEETFVKSPIPESVYEDYPGEWVLIEDGEVVANSEEFGALPEYKKGQTIWKVPEMGFHF